MRLRIGDFCFTDRRAIESTAESFVNYNCIDLFIFSSYVALPVFVFEFRMSSTKLSENYVITICKCRFILNADTLQSFFVFTRVLMREFHHYFYLRRTIEVYFIV